MNHISGFGRSNVSAALPKARYAYHVTFAGTVRVTTDPIEVARIRRAYPSAQVQIVLIG
jgi:hypothetical protein